MEPTAAQPTTSELVQLFADHGLALTLVAVAVSGAGFALGYWFFRLWLPDKIERSRAEREHLMAKQKMEINREIKTERLLDTMGEVIPKQLALAERLAVRQELHAANCERTDRNLGELVELVKELRTS